MKNELEKLYNTYQSAFEKSSLSFKDKLVCGPFLMSPGKEYTNASKKLLIIGQETNGWNASTSIGTQMAEYRVFKLGNKYNSPFWSVTRKLEQALNIDRCSCAWTNINKYDEDQDKPQGDILKTVEEFDGLLIEEIDILKPDICMFFIGPTLHHRVMKLFTGIEFIPVNGWKRNALTQLKHPLLPEKTYVTYHPAYLRRSGLEADFIKYFEGV
jgi:hypothetical protein